MTGGSDTLPRERMYCQTIRIVRDMSRDDRAIIATCRLRTPTDRLKENYSIDMAIAVDRAKRLLVHHQSSFRISPYELNDDGTLFHCT